MRSKEYKHHEILVPQLDAALEKKMKVARGLSWEKFGRKITFYLPGMIRYKGQIGKYPAISITGDFCELACKHCRGKLLEPMIKATTPKELIELCKKLERAGNVGVLLTGGSDAKGRMPWKRFAPAIEEIKKSTNLKISLHSGIIDEDTAVLLADAGLDQALIDVIGDDRTMKEVYNLNEGIGLIKRSLEYLFRAGIKVVPHIVIGLHFGSIIGEIEAVKMLKEFEPEALVFVVLTAFKGTPMQFVKTPSPIKVADIICDARFNLPGTLLCLGCERSRGEDGYLTELLAIESGINRVAIESDYAIEHAKSLGLKIEYRETCCSLP